MKPLNSNTQAYNNLKAAFIAVMLILFGHPAIAAGGLDEATNWVNEIADWAYKLLGAAVFVYSIVMVILALLEKKTWGDVGISIAKAAAAGGIVAA
ncbi:conjugal transfer protein, partial [Vibrio harveyi]